MLGIFQQLFETFLSLFLHQWRIGIFGQNSCRFLKKSSVPNSVCWNLSEIEKLPSFLSPSEIPIRNTENVRPREMYARIEHRKRTLRLQDLFRLNYFTQNKYIFKSEVNVSAWTYLLLEGIWHRNLYFDVLSASLPGPGSVLMKTTKWEGNFSEKLSNFIIIQMLFKIT